jgi:tetratricopeptide (TPR) repeat protein
VVGRHEARVGRFEEARALLDEARTLYAAEDDEVELLTTDARLAECLVLQGAVADARAHVEGALREAEQMAGVSVIVANLHRLLGWTHLQAGELDAAREALERSLHLARLEDENFGIRSADYEVALTLSARVRLGAVTGEPTDGLAAERDAIFARLGVLKVPEPPLDATAPAQHVRR